MLLAQRPPLLPLCLAERLSQACLHPSRAEGICAPARGQGTGFQGMAWENMASFTSGGSFSIVERGGQTGPGVCWEQETQGRIYTWPDPVS